MDKPNTLQEAIIYFADPTRCLLQMIKTRFPNGTTCIRCGVVSPTLLKTTHRFKCNSCKAQFSVKVGTIFEHSPIPLTKWLPAVWMITGAKNGISSCELARSIGVTQKTAWFMLHRIRESVSQGSMDMFAGPVEVDETAVGGLEKFKHKHKRKSKGSGGDHNLGKQIVLGILNRNTKISVSKVKAEIIYNVRTETLIGKVKQTVEERAIVNTDALHGYRALSETHDHQFVDHAEMYAIGTVHTNGIENFWALLKRCLKGTYIAVEPFHLKRYVDEMVYRFNERDGNDATRFNRALKSAIGKRLTYDQLIRSYETYYDRIFPRTS